MDSQADRAPAMGGRVQAVGSARLPVLLLRGGVEPVSREAQAEKESARAEYEKRAAREAKYRARKESQVNPRRK